MESLGSIVRLVWCLFGSLVGMFEDWSLSLFFVVVVLFDGRLFHLIFFLSIWKERNDMDF